LRHRERREVMNILVAIDSSPSTEVVLSEVAARPWTQDSKICVLHVLDLFGMAFRVEDRGPISDVESQAAERLVKSAAARLAVTGVEITTAVTEGFPPTNIIEYADRWAADFIIVGSHAHSGFSRFLLGSVAQGILRAAHCSVEVVRPRRAPDRRGMRILLATDGSDYALDAARSLASRPWPEGTEVKVISSVSVIMAAADPWYSGGEVSVRLLEEQRKYAVKYVEAAEKLIRASGLNVTGAVLTGWAKGSIVNEAEDWGADLVVVGSQGRRGFSRVLLGSVSEAVAMHAPCSVDVIRAQGSEHHE
jgi:nucleotide-binding universal stress UspA family protein